MYLNDCIFIRDDEDLFLNRITFPFSAILYTIERYITRRKTQTSLVPLLPLISKNIVSLYINGGQYKKEVLEGSRKGQDG